MNTFRIFFILFFATQFYLTLFGGFLWPFSSHRLFSQYPESTKKIIQIGITDSFNYTRYVHPGQVLHLEYARCSGLIRNVYLYGNLTYQKNALYNYMLQRINKPAWNNFDEILPMFNSFGLNITSLSIEEHLVNLTYGLQLLEKRILYPNSFVPEIKVKTNKSFSIIKFIFCSLIAYALSSFNNSVNQLQMAKRIYLLRMLLVFVVIVMINFGNYSFYSETADFLFSSSYLSPLTSDQFRILLLVVQISGVLWAIEGYSLFTPISITGITFVVSFAYLQYYITLFSTSYWITTTHLNIFSALLLLPKSYSSQILTFFQTYVAVMYFQAGFSKLMLGGLSWFITGRRIWTEALLLGTPFGKYLANQSEFIFIPFGWSTFLFELLLSPLLLSERYQHKIAIIAVLFHCGTYFILGITFWFIIILYPILFN